MESLNLQQPGLTCRKAKRLVVANLLFTSRTKGCWHPSVNQLPLSRLAGSCRRWAELWFAPPWSSCRAAWSRRRSSWRCAARPCWLSPGPCPPTGTRPPSPTWWWNLARPVEARPPRFRNWKRPSFFYVCQSELQAKKKQQKNTFLLKFFTTVTQTLHWRNNSKHWEKGQVRCADGQSPPSLLSWLKRAELIIGKTY